MLVTIVRTAYNLKGTNKDRLLIFQNDHSNSLRNEFYCISKKGFIFLHPLLVCVIDGLIHTFLIFFIVFLSYWTPFYQATTLNNMYPNLCISCYFPKIFLPLLLHRDVSFSSLMLVNDSLASSHL